MVRRTKEEAQQTREAILEAAEHVFHRKGLSRSSLRDVADEAGLTRGAIYWHFKNKHDLFAAITERCQIPKRHLRAIAESPTQEDPLGRMRDFLLFMTRDIAENSRSRRIFEIIFHKTELTEDNEPLSSRHRQMFQDSTNSMRTILQNAIARGQLSPDLDVERAILQLHIKLTGLIYFWLLLPDTFDLAIESERMVDTYIYTLQNCPDMGKSLPQGQPTQGNHV